MAWTISKKGLQTLLSTPGTQVQLSITNQFGASGLSGVVDRKCAPLNIILDILTDFIW